MSEVSTDGKLLESDASTNMDTSRTRASRGAAVLDVELRPARSGSFRRQLPTMPLMHGSVTDSASSQLNQATCWLSSGGGERSASAPSKR